jgi:hypothetical protein
MDCPNRILIGLSVSTLTAMACSGGITIAPEGTIPVGGTTVNVGGTAMGGTTAVSSVGGATVNVGGGTAMGGATAASLVGGTASNIGGGVAGGSLAAGGATSKVGGTVAAGGSSVGGQAGATCVLYNPYPSSLDPTTPGCLYYGRTYPTGSCMFDEERCNSLQCLGNDMVSSTGRGCICNPSGEWWRHYLAAGSCAADACPANTWQFTNQCGCGCQESLGNCPEYFDCMPGPNTPSPCPTAEQSALCPYTIVAT